MDELTVEFAKEVVRQEELGAGEATDFLAVSLSATDYMGHLFGPASLEQEDNLLRLDRVLASFFAFLDEEIGLENTLIVLSADHGGPEAPEHAAGEGTPTGRFALDHFRKPNEITSALERRFGRGDLLHSHSHPYLYLDYDAVRDAGLEPERVERFVAAEAARIRGVRTALAKCDVLADDPDPSPLEVQVRRSFHPDRSGSVHLVQEPYWFLHSTEEAEKLGVKSLAAIHGSPWDYDSHVPIFFAGHGVPAQKVDRRVETVDVAATLAAYLGIPRPTAAVGEALPEVLGIE
jgi:predicted AlkP superfamily pyrophosphatase or phosphodiesterase